MKKIGSIKVTHYHVLGLFIVLSYIYGITQFKNNDIIKTFDLEFQLSRIYSLSDVFFSPTNFDTFGSYGQPINIFYGWLTVLPAYLFFKISNNMASAYNMYLFFITFVTLLCSYFCMYRIFKEKFVSVFFSLIYTFSMYRTLSIFFRGALGEVIGIAFLPLVFGAAYGIILQKKDEWLLLSIGFSLLVYTHVLSTIIAFVFILVFYISAMVSKLSDKKEITISFLKAGISSVILSLPFFISLLEEQTFQGITPPGWSDLDNRALTMKQLILGAFRQDFTTYSFGIILLILTTITLLLFFKLKTQYKYILILGILTLLMTTKLFPWKLVQETPIILIQFPWRLMSIATLLLCFISSYVIKNLLKKDELKMVGVCITAIILIFINVYSVSHSPFVNNRIGSDDIPNIISSYKTDNYKPVGYEKYDYLTNNHLVSVDGVPKQTDRVVTENEYKFKVITTKSDELILPIYFYKGMQVFINEKKVEISQANHPMISIMSVSGENKIKVVFRYSMLSKLSVAISMVWWIIIAIWLLKYNKLHLK